VRVLDARGQSVGTCMKDDHGDASPHSSLTVSVKIRTNMTKYDTWAIFDTAP